MSAAGFSREVIFQQYVSPTAVCQGGLGCASYHFFPASVTDWPYIEYTEEAAKANNWLDMANPKYGTEKKYFNNPTYAGSTFTADIIWEPPWAAGRGYSAGGAPVSECPWPLDSATTETDKCGDTKWDYEIIFNEDFSEIVGGHVITTVKAGMKKAEKLYVAPSKVTDADLKTSPPLLYKRFTGPDGSADSETGGMPSGSSAIQAAQVASLPTSLFR